MIPTTGRKLLTGLLILCLGILVGFSGCLSSQNDHAPHEIAITGTPSPQPAVTPYAARIDRIGDYHMDSSFTIMGSPVLVVNGTTDLPAGTKVPLIMYEEANTSDIVFRTEIGIKSNGSGPNSFSTEYNLTGNPPGVYRVMIDSDLVNRRTTFSLFRIRQDIPDSKWIAVNRIGLTVEPVHFGEVVPIYGTTNLPSGSTLLVRTSMIDHPCTGTVPADEEGYLCGGCRSPVSEQTALVIAGAGGVNSWNSTIDTSNMCVHESNRISVSSVTWPDTVGSREIPLEIPSSEWILINPLTPAHPGENVPVSGTTDLPAGSEILVRAEMELHPCARPGSYQFPNDSLCGGCRSPEPEYTTLVIMGAGGINTWNMTIDTTGMCVRERNMVLVSALNRTNVAGASRNIPLG